ncbi:hypothetical protein SAMN05421640_2485 [Ekhidna lutea]|uniref:Uncharacterized protein n=1 Tax=Ekhidna lutea TaxID=447679 RepID=A0A239K766_EKHLU|nr:hypothetical protein SAMN05421640_2485 [Ekhidna lutea]
MMEWRYRNNISLSENTEAIFSKHNIAQVFLTCALRREREEKMNCRKEIDVVGGLSPKDLNHKIVRNKNLYSASLFN